VEVFYQCISQETLPMQTRPLTAFILIICLSCQRQDNPSELYGRWILDSTSGIGGKIISGKPREHTEFTLNRDEKFNFKWSDVDVFSERSGTYIYQNRNNEIMPLLIFSSNSQNNNGSVDHRDTLIVLSLSDSLLKTQETERYTLLDSTLVVQNRINVYRKH
jgi:hypothetical protein